MQQLQQFTYKQLQAMQVKAFVGHTLKPQAYSEFLKDDIEYLQDDHDFVASDFVSNGLLNEEDQALMYLYEQEFMDSVTLGLMVELSLKDYQNKIIRKHEKTLKRAHLDHLSIKKGYFGPVIVGYQYNEEIDGILRSIRKETDPFAMWDTSDGRSHRIWKIASNRHQPIQKIFKKVANCCILDGHHRFQAAAKYLEYIGENAIEKDRWIQGLAYSTTYIRTYPQHRQLLKTQDVNVAQIFKEASGIDIQELAGYDGKYELILLQNGRYYAVEVKNWEERLCVEELEEILSTHLKERKEKVYKKIKYLSGVFFSHEQYVQQGDKNAVFLVKNPDIEAILDFANSGKVMPPKSTWLQPKPCLHMIVRLPY